MNLDEDYHVHSTFSDDGATSPPRRPANHPMGPCSHDHGTTERVNQAA